MIPAEAAAALLDHMRLPRGAISVWVHRSPTAQPGANPEICIAINPGWSGDRKKIPAQIGNYFVKKEDWSTPLEGDTLEFAERHLMEPIK